MTPGCTLCARLTHECEDYLRRKAWGRVLRAVCILYHSPVSVDRVIGDDALAAVAFLMQERASDRERRRNG